MIWLTRTLFFATVLLPFGCGDGSADDRPPDDSDRLYIIADDAASWTTVVVDYPDGRFDDLEFVSAPRTQMLDSGAVTSGIYQYAMNISDDLFKGIWREVTDLAPGRRRFRVTAEIATPTPSDCFVGGGASVYMKVGLLTERPSVTIVDGDVRAAFDKGQQSVPGATVPVVGDATNDLLGCPDERWGLKTLVTTDPIEIEIGPDGVAFLLFASESAFESPDELIYTKIKLQDLGLVQTPGLAAGGPSRRPQSTDTNSSEG